MDQLTILARLSELRLLRDLADLAKHRKAVSAIEEKERAIRSLLVRETSGAIVSEAHNQSTATAYTTYVDNTQRRLASLKAKKLNARAAEATFQQAAVRAQSRARAVEILQKQALAQQRAAAARRDEATNMSCLTGHQKTDPPDW